MLKMAACFEDYEEECYHSEDPDIHFAFNEPELYKELCSESSTLRAKYLEHVACYKSMHNDSENGDIIRTCINNGRNAYDLYAEAVDSNVNRTIKHHKICLEMSFIMGCVSAEVRMKCGEEAYKISLEILKLKESTIWTRSHCSHVDYEKEIKNGFFPSLNIGENHRQTLNEVLKYIKEHMNDVPVIVFGI
ncbi:uncharacterized protein NPIL_66981 [Nephila pilipes]|uniref:Uncharacterized protein n=1 Tax=Nephila pilipes TaxID=299642 RepID=A0A8X6TKV4_NEPPI|nr:uncharacterized protein NPIL_66981 [Nephila pilipes]